MPNIGHAGRYDEVCERARDETKARGVVLYVLEGDKGSGFSCTSSAADARRLNADLPRLLRQMADAIEAAPAPDGVRVTLSPK
jgi:hypothetical protein